MPKPKKTKKDDLKKNAGNARGNASRDTTGPHPPRQDGMRETIESIVVAFILAFLFRTFEAEAFVIPTGSMAPTLLGRHKDVDCEQCGYHFTVGASSEIDNNGFLTSRIEMAYCPNCRNNNDVKNLPVFKGDRILVNKFPFEFGNPSRWDVLVFKYPEGPITNYIKRLVGLPDETIELSQGNVYRHTDEGRTILRKNDPNKQKELQILVYDHDHAPKTLLERGWPERWAPVRKQTARDDVAGWSEDDSGWVADPQSRSFELGPDKTAGTQHRWIRYRHFDPTTSDWNDANNGDSLYPLARLITDYCGYNAYETYNTDHGFYWVGDLTLHCRLDVDDVQEDAEILLELNEGVRRYRCRFDVNTGQAAILFIDDQLDSDEQRELATAATEVQGRGTYDVLFANVDDRLCLWVNGALIDFGTNGEYHAPALPAPQDGDLIPVGIAARGARVVASRLVIKRDIYYRNEFMHPDDQYESDERHMNHRTIDEYNGSKETLDNKRSDPDAWYDEYTQGLSINKTGTNETYEDIPFTFTLGPDEYFMMGDNSPRSKDSRLWPNSRKATHRYAVKRSALVGKAFFIYWPHGVPFQIPFLAPEHGRPIFYHKTQQGEGTDYPSFRVPFYPHVTRMHRIR